MLTVIIIIIIIIKSDKCVNVETVDQETFTWLCASSEVGTLSCVRKQCVREIPGINMSEDVS